MDNRYGKEDSYWNEHEEILSFGYSCKLFRDDLKAKEIDEGFHLIPCMADSKLNIDRFDVRGALTDLTEAQFKEEVTMTEEEELEEKQCDYERFCDYPEYYHSNYNEEYHHDEEQKRLQMEMESDMYTYNQVKFSYTGENYIPEIPEEHKNTTLQLVDGDKFFPNPQLNIHEGMEIPKTVKQHKIITKTAAFVVDQGAQMEIVLMTKQAGNESFNFMSFDNILNPYYKHIMNQIRTGKLKVTQENDDDKEAQQNNVQFNIPHVTPDLTPGVKPAAKTSTQCSYSTLLSNILERQKASGVEEADVSSPVAPSSPAMPAGLMAIVNDKVQTAQSTSIRPIVRLVDYPSFNLAAGDSSEEEETAISPKANCVNIQPSKVYDYNNMQWPSPELQMVIDKLACYIVKNGPSFRELVKNKRDPRFDFLNIGNEYNPYYQCKLQLYNEVYGDTFNHQQKGAKMSATPIKSSSSIQRTKYSSKGRAISFSIKKKDEEPPLSSHTTFPVESSTTDEEMDDEDKDSRRMARELKRIERKNREDKTRKEREVLMSMERSRKEEKVTKGEEDGSDNDDLYDIFKYAQNLAKEDDNNDEGNQKTQSKQLQRKIKAAAFLGKLQKGSNTNGGPPVYGPHLPVVLKSNMDMLRPTEDIGSSNSSTHSGSNNDRLKNSPSPVPSASEDSTRNWLIKEISKSPLLENDKIIPVSSEFVGELQEQATESIGPVSPKENWSRSWHKKSHKRSRSPSPEHHRERRKKKKSHSSHKRKKRHSRSRSKSKDRSKSHRSSHKRRKHVSHKDRSKPKKRKHRKYRSPSVSSLSSESSKISSNFPSDSDSEVQVISSKIKKSTSRSSSVMSLADVKMTSIVQSAGDSPSTDGNSGKTTSTNNGISISRIPLSLPAEDTNSSLSDIQESDKKSGFNAAKSSAVTKITEGLRAKLYAMLDKDSNI